LAPRDNAAVAAKAAVGARARETSKDIYEFLHIVCGGAICYNLVSIKKLSDSAHFGVVGMKKSSHLRTSIVFLFVSLLTSATTMLWLFWHFPIATGIATLTVLVGLCISARLAISTDSDGLSELDHGDTGVQPH
jgi:hypothetical protein